MVTATLEASLYSAKSSPQQIEVFNFIRYRKGHGAVQATAGAGKTFTLVECLKLIPRLKKAIFLSFSKAIVKELAERIPSNIKAATLHSLGCRMIMAKYRGVNVNENKYFKLALDHFEKKDKESYKRAFGVQDICNYARLTLTPFTEEALKELCDQYCIDANPEQIEIAVIILKANTKLKKSLREIDYADMIYFPAVYSELVVEKYDYVFVDEVQDTNNAQAELINNIIRKPNGRLIICGDEKQAIYGFQGSNIDSFQRIEERFGCKRMELTVTYRCAKSIVELAQTVYPEVIEAWEGSKEGIVRRGGELAEAREGDMVICRNTKPLIAAFFYFLNKGVKSYVVGKDFEKGLINLAESVAGYSKTNIMQNIEDKLASFYQQLKDDGIGKPEHNPKYIALQEKCEILYVILERCDMARDLVPTIIDIFHEDRQAIKLLTAHRSKGLECERVFFIETYNKKQLLPSEYAVMGWQKIQEQNLLFVVYTRAKQEFVFVDYND
jgi:DNA helicase-2/ATP-dependent DNA helicase PcrA